MHELALTTGILNIALGEAQKHGAQRVLEIRIKVGALAGIIPGLIQQYYNIASLGTAAERATLIIEQVPASLECGDCGLRQQIQGYVFTCPACGSERISLLSGREFYIDTLEVE